MTIKIIVFTGVEKEDQTCFLPGSAQVLYSDL